MELYDGLLTRRSIRKYTRESVSKEIVEKIVKAGMYAPSAVNCQPWHYVIVDDRSVLEKIMEVHPYSRMLSEAQYAILVLGDEKLEHAPGYWVVDCAAATQNILLAAHSFGLGAVWLGLHPREHRKEAISKLFNLPGHILPFSIVSLGYPAEKPEPKNRYKQERIHYNKW
ncbi:MAG: nitroreductase family protein [Bacteroidales bacterium]